MGRGEKKKSKHWGEFDERNMEVPETQISETSPVHGWGRGVLLGQSNEGPELLLLCLLRISGPFPESGESTTDAAPLGCLQ